MRLPVPPCPLASLVIVEFCALRSGLVSVESFLSFARMDVLLTFMAYTALAGAYLIIIPLSLMLWIQRRLTCMGKIERLVLYSMVFLFFPGMIVFAPFLNFRPYGQGEG